MTNGPKIELGPGRDGKWYFHIKHTNGKVSAPSQGYKERRYAREAAKRDHPGFPIVYVEKI